MSCVDEERDGGQTNSSLSLVRDGEKDDDEVR